MQKKLLAVAVAGALVAPSAFAQTSVTISGALNLWWESASATGASIGRAGDTLSRDRIVDGAGSNIRFTVVEDIGGGMQAFGQVESAVLNNAETRNNAAGAGATTSGWGNRNSGIGLRSSAWGEILLGVWDLHYHEHYAADSHILKGTSNSNSLGLMNQFGTSGNGNTAYTIGARYNNVIRYASPNWSGFSFRLAYARPTDAAPVNATGTQQDDKKNRVWNFAPSYSAGPLFVFYSHLRDKDINVTPTFFTGMAAGAAALGAGTSDIRSDRIVAAYTFPFGLKIGLIYDRSKLNHTPTSPAVGSEIKRDVWVFPLSYTAGAHAVHFQYSRARDWKGNVGGVDLGAAAANITPVAGGSVYSPGGDTGAKMFSIGYQYDLSKRTNLHLSYSKITNEALAGYDFFSAPANITASTGAGADPRVYSIGLRHAF